jgi:hypothetical protein
VWRCFRSGLPFLAYSGHPGLAKMHDTRKARAIAADARDMLGGTGVLLGYQVAWQMADLEAIHTFEGTETMQTLIAGRAITGIGAFASALAGLRRGRRTGRPAARSPAGRRTGRSR